MLQNIKQIAVLNKIFNVHGSEWSKITVAWFILFLYRVGFVIGWTVMVAMFVSKYGIASLPYLFVLTGVFTIIGSFFYSTFLDKVKSEYIMVATIFVAGVVLFAAARIAMSNPVLSFALLIVAVATFLMQFKIILSAYFEEMFTPLESERTFPLIEAAETVGGIVAGLTVTLLASSIDTFQFIYLWIGSLFLIIPLILFYDNYNEGIAIIQKEPRMEANSVGIINKMKKAFSSEKHRSYIKGLFLIVFFQWLLFNLLEFQYTKAVYQNVSNVVLEAGSGFEHAFVHNLGILFILFSASALVVQFFIGSRIINYLGVVGTMLLHPIVTLLSLFGLTLLFNFPTAVLTKNNFTITSVLYKNAYHSSYYAVKENLRKHLRELLEGVVRPIGAIAGTLGLVLLQRFFVGVELIFSVNVLMMAVALTIFYITYLQQKKYTRIAVDDLISSSDKKTRFNAIDILAQKGHEFSFKVLRKVLLNEDEPVSIRVKVLRALGELQNIQAISDIIQCFDSNKANIRDAAIDALSSYKLLQGFSKKRLFIKYNLVNALKTLYRKEKNEEILIKIIRLLAKLSNVVTFEFLLDILKTGRGNSRVEAIYALGNYDDENVVQLLKPYLNSRSLKQQINAAIALSRFDSSNNEAMRHIDSFFYSKSPEKISYALYAFGELGLKRKKKVCLNYLKSNNMNLRTYSAIALAKMGYQDSIPVLIDLLFSKDDVLVHNVKKLLKNVDVRISRNIDKIVAHIVSEEVEKIMGECKAESLNELKSSCLFNLRRLYSLVEEYEEIEVIDNLIKS